MNQCAVGEASKTRDNSALCLVISLAECAPSEVATHGATNGRRKRRAVKALEIDVLMDAPPRGKLRENETKITRLKLLNARRLQCSGEQGREKWRCGALPVQVF